MVVTPLFVVVLVLLASTALFTGWLQRSRRLASRELPALTEDQRASSSAVSAATPAAALRLETIESHAAGERVRVVVRAQLEGIPEDDVVGILERLAHELYRSTQANVVLIEARLEGHTTPFVHLFAPDGRGWWGQEFVRTAWRGPGFEARSSPPDEAAVGAR